MLDLSGPVPCLYCGQNMQPFGECTNPECDPASFDVEMYAMNLAQSHNPMRLPVPCEVFGQQIEMNWADYEAE